MQHEYIPVQPTASNKCVSTSQQQAMSTGWFWMSMLTVCAMTMGMRYFQRTAQWLYRPQDTQILSEKEKREGGPLGGDMAWQTVRRLECLLSPGSASLPRSTSKGQPGAGGDALERLADYVEGDDGDSSQGETYGGYAKVNGTSGQTEQFATELAAMPRNLSASSGVSVESMIGRDRPRSDDPLGERSQRRTRSSSSRFKRSH